MHCKAFSTSVSDIKLEVSQLNILSILEILEFIYCFNVESEEEDGMAGTIFESHPVLCVKPILKLVYP